MCDAVVGCDAPVIRPKGMCGPHYSRYSIYGDPLAPRPQARGISTLRRLIAIETDECIVWPLGLSSRGYGKVKFEGRSRGAHAVALELAFGPMPIDKQVAAHGECHRPACINPRHLRWATYAENNNDRRRDGTMPVGERNGLATLSDDVVRRIRSLTKQGESPARISRTLGIADPTARDVIKGRTWKHVA